MKTLNREDTHIEFDKFWDELKTEWFKVEALQDYSAEDESDSLKEWFSGNREGAIKLIKSNINLSEDNNKINKIRIHIVDEPYSEYLLWEIEHYKLVNIPIEGEKVFLLNREDIKNLEISDGDFMIFDNKKVIRNHYGPDGKMYKADLYYEEDNISDFLALKNNILSSHLLPILP